MQAKLYSGEPLWHLSSRTYRSGDTIGPHSPSRFWAASTAHPQKAAAENHLEQARPASAPPRRNAVYATGFTPTVESFLLHDPSLHVYCVRIPEGALRAGHLDMRHADVITAALTKGRALPDATAYWDRRPNSLIPTSASWEVISETLVIVGEVSSVERAPSRLRMFGLDARNLICDGG